MASLTPTTTRRVLSDLNVNAPFAQNGPRDLRSLSTSPRKPTKVVEAASSKISIPFSPTTRLLGKTVHQEAGNGGLKRPASAMSGATTADHGDESQVTKRRASTHQGPGLGKGLSVGAETHRDDVFTEADSKSTKSGSPMPACRHNAGSSSPQSSSPTSLFESNSVALEGGECSQNTIHTNITEPNHSPRGFAIAHSVGYPRTPEQIRQDAKAIKLRLSLASYKLRTNQLDIPLERLQVKTLRLLPLSRLPRLLNSSTTRKRKPLPSGSSSIPNINILADSSIEKESYCSESSSSPPHRLQSSLETTTTPILPRQRQALLNPPNLENTLGTQTPKNRSPKGGDLTSSVVKGRAAVGLLSLMGARN